MKTRILLILFGIITILLTTFFITFSCSEVNDTNIGEETSCTEINTVEELQAISDTLDGSFCLNQDIDLTSIENFTPIGNYYSSFTGTFDGKSMKIINLSINRETGNNIGLFGKTSESAVIKNLTIENASVIGNSDVGILVGFNQAIITNVHITGTSSVEGKASDTGGIIGENLGSVDREVRLSNSSSNASVTGTGVVGGLVGRNSTNTHITNSGCTASTITGTGNNIGGLVGYNTSNSTITNCSSTGNVEGIENVGGLVGYNISSSTITNSNGTGVVNGTSNVGGLAGKQYNSTITGSYATGNVSATSAAVGGLVGENISSSTITDSYASGDVSSTAGHVGGLVGYASNNANITGSYAEGTVTSTGNQVGGLIGLISINSTLEDSYATGAVEGNEYIGGLIGILNTFSQDASDTTSITNCHATGNVISSKHGGGFSGGALYATISKSYASTGTIQSSQNTGGFIGYAVSITVTNSYATGAVNGLSGVTGGFIGRSAATTEINYSYATGNVSSTSLQKGGFVGKNLNLTGSNNYYDKTLTGLTNGVYDTDDTTVGVTGIDTTDITGGSADPLEPFATAGWDFITIWIDQGAGVWPTLVAP